MKIIVVGCGRVGAELSYRLFKRGHDVSVIDNVEASFDNLPSDFSGRMHVGDALNQDVLRRAGLESANALAAVTNSDSLNVVVAHIAKSIFNIKRVVARNYSPNERSIFETFNLQVVSSTVWGAQRLEEMIYQPDIRQIYSAGNGEVEVYELSVPQEWHGMKVKELLSCGNCAVVALTRAGRAVLPTEDMSIQVGDVALISATDEGAESMRLRLNSARGKEEV